eukprot:CAMPEP_0185787184 /NCGR_PEP_ID=MMETSP1174-20130828/139176_1 /TAXON_ID=35687 /ORGANISM="Dictyocha speculum, Strain CCMP1381" /LENGTH=220 /DNA_ID=CAMNT_0028480199 /DNA_START=1 /DNA_END=663 /DNA_ORIENTATION=-
MMSHERLKNALMEIGAIRGETNQGTSPVDARLEHAYDIIIIECPFGQDQLFKTALFTASGTMIVAEPGGNEVIDPILKKINSMNISLRNGAHQLKKANWLVCNMYGGTKNHRTVIDKMIMKIEKQGGKHIGTIPRCNQIQDNIRNHRPMTAMRETEKFKKFVERRRSSSEEHVSKRSKGADYEVRYQFKIIAERLAEEYRAQLDLRDDDLQRGLRNSLNS